MRIVLLICLCAISTKAFADDATPDHERAGLELYRAESYAEAIPHLEAAAAVRQEARVLMALGDCYRKLHEYKKAGESYQRILSSEPPPDVQSRARAGLEAATRDELEWRRSHPPGSSSPMGPASRTAVSAPSPNPSAESTRQVVATQPPATQPTVALLPDAVESQRIESIDSRSPSQAAPSNERSLALPITVLGAATAAGVLGVMFGLQTNSHADEMNRAQNSSDYASALSAANSSATKATISWIAAGALAAAGGALLIWKF